MSINYCYVLLSYFSTALHWFVLGAFFASCIFLGLLRSFLASYSTPVAAMIQNYAPLLILLLPLV
jgi:hypothetical protein